MRRGSPESQRPIGEGERTGRRERTARRGRGEEGQRAVLEAAKNGSRGISGDAGMIRAGSQPQGLLACGGGEGRGMEDTPGWPWVPCAFYWPDQRET